MDTGLSDSIDIPKEDLIESSHDRWGLIKESGRHHVLLDQFDMERSDIKQFDIMASFITQMRRLAKSLQIAYPLSLVIEPSS